MIAAANAIAAICNTRRIRKTLFIFIVVFYLGVRSLFRKRRKKVHKVIQLGRRKSLSVVGGHRRLIAIRQLRERRFLQQMYCPILRNELKREIVLVARNSLYCCPIRKSHDHGAPARIEFAIRCDDCFANRFWRTPLRVITEVGREESALSPGHMATATRAFAKEDFSSAQSISRQFRCDGSSLKRPKMGDESPSRFQIQKCERRHRSISNAPLQNLQNPFIGELAHVRPCRYVGGALSSFAVQSVAARTIG